MGMKIFDVLVRAFGTFVFAIIFLCISYRAFPTRWLPLATLFVFCLPLAAIYGLLVGPQSGFEASTRRFRVPGLPLIAIAIVSIVVVHALYPTEIERIFYGNK